MMIVFHKNLKFVSIRLNFLSASEIWNLTPYIVDCPLHCPFHRAYRHFVFFIFKIHVFVFVFVSVPRDTESHPEVDCPFRRACRHRIGCQALSHLAR